MQTFLRTPAVALVLIPILTLSPVWGQIPASPAPAADRAAGADQITIQVVDSDGPQSLVGSRSLKGLTVHVTDGNGSPVSDAAIAVRLPDSEPSGLFSGGSRSAVVYTDAAGSARINGIQWNTSPGVVPIRITATNGDRHAGILWEQTLTLTPASTTPAQPALRPGMLPATPAIPATPRAEESQPEVFVGTPAITAPAPPPPTRPIHAGIEPSVSVTHSSQDDADPSVSISNSPGGFSSHSSLKKWLIWAAVLGAGAGAGYAFAGKGSSASSSASSSGVSIGTPTINIGH